VRCFRDEDLRADRQPEFTQIDLEMSFPRPEAIFHVVEGFLKAAFLTIRVDLQTPFPRMSYDQAIRLYGTDKPDLRLPAMVTANDEVHPELAETLRLSLNAPVIVIRIPNVGQLTRRQKDQLKAFVDDHKPLKYVPWWRLEQGEWSVVTERIRKRFDNPDASDLFVMVGVDQNDPDLAARQFSERVYKTAGQLRLTLAQVFADRWCVGEALKEWRKPRLLWVTDFPMFEWDETEQRWNAAHHPFTSPHDEDMDKLESDPGAVRAQAYDVVLNGTELGSGSIRIHRQDIQAKIFNALGMSPEEQEARFGFFLEALQYGTPPHGGIALGLDRIVMILAGAESLREVIPLPKTAKAVDLMVDAPTPVSARQLKELGIAVVGKKDL